MANPVTYLRQSPSRQFSSILEGDAAAVGPEGVIFPLPTGHQGLRAPTELPNSMPPVSSSCCTVSSLRLLTPALRRRPFKNLQVHAVRILHEDRMCTSAEVHDLSVGGDDIHSRCLHLTDGGGFIVDLNAQRGRARVANTQVERSARNAAQLRELYVSWRAGNHAGQLAVFGPRRRADQLQHRRVLRERRRTCQLNPQFPGVKRACRIGVFHGVRERNTMNVPLRGAGGGGFLDQLNEEAVRVAQDDGAGFALSGCLL